MATYRTVSSSSYSNDPLNILYEFIDEYWMPKDSTNANSFQDEEEIQRIYTELMTVENQFDDFYTARSSLNVDKPHSPNKNQDIFYKSDDSRPPSSPSITSISSNDADDEPFDFQEWRVYDQTTCKTRPPKLLEFLHLLLNNKRYKFYASWLNQNEGLFRIYEPDQVACLWRRVKSRKTNGSMNYDTFSRGIRYYYKSGLMIKTHTKHTYCFAKI